MSKREDTAVVQDIKESLHRIISYTSKGVNIDIVWNIAKNEIPLLHTQINDINS